MIRKKLKYEAFSRVYIAEIEEANEMFSVQRQTDIKKINLLDYKKKKKTFRSFCLCSTALALHSCCLCIYDEDFPEQMLLILHNSTHVSLHEIFFYVQRSLNKLPQSISSNEKEVFHNRQRAAIYARFLFSATDAPASAMFTQNSSPMMILNNDENERRKNVHNFNIKIIDCSKEILPLYWNSFVKDDADVE